MESRIDAPRVAIVQERPGNPGWVEFIERFFPTACLSAEEAVGGPIPANDFLILNGRMSWVEGWVRGTPRVEPRAGLLIVLRHWSARAAAQMLWQAADDVVGPCVEGPELCARIHAILRRGRAPRAADSDAAFGMRRAERRLLEYLRASPGRIITQSEILNNVFGGDRASGTSLVRVHVSRLRRRLGTAGALRTVRGAGYVLELGGGVEEAARDLPKSA
jgi:two-component system phosphate regulon response regulator PhoB